MLFLLHVSQALLIIVKVYYYKYHVSVAIYFKKCHILRKRDGNTL